MNDTVSILSTLATLPSGAVGLPLDNDELTRYLQANYATDGESARNKRHALRDELYRDGGIGYMNGVIDTLFADPDVRRLRKAVVPFARFNNALKRIVNEMSTVYAEPARRIVEDADGPNGEKYRALLDLICMDERMVEVSRLLNLHRALLVGFRVRQLPNGDREPVLDIATPANVRAVTHPNDSALVIGWLVRTEYRTARETAAAPAWTLWTDHESVKLREDLSVIGGTYVEHGLGVCPWVPVTLGSLTAGFWPGNEGEDMVAGHTTIWFENILLIKESKSATKQTLLQGDGTNMGRGQSADSETVNELADGQSATTVDMSMDLDLFKGTADHVLSHLAQNYGMSPALISHQGVQSAEARELMRLPLKEIRRQQQIPLRRFEHRLALVMAAVLAVDDPARKFSPVGWRIEFAESETPLDPISEMTLFEKRTGAGLDNHVAFLQRRFPGLTAEAALEMIGNNWVIKTDIVRMSKDFMAESGALGPLTPKGEEPAQVDDVPPDAAEPTASLRDIAEEVLNADQ